MQSWVDKVLFIVVVYEQQWEASPTYKSLKDTAAANNLNLEVFVWDNGLLPQTILDDRHFKYHYVHDPDNPGVSRAYNQGAEKAVTLGKEWIWIFDQDVEMPQHVFPRFWEAVKEHSNHVLFCPVIMQSEATISPLKLRFGKGFALIKPDSGFYSLEHFMCINSGLLIRLELFQAARGYNETFPLDFSDFAFMQRLKPSTSDFFLVDVAMKLDFSGAEIQDRNTSIQRFARYCEAAIRYAEKYGNIANMIFPFFRALKLSLAHRSFSFLNICLKLLKDNYGLGK